MKSLLTKILLAVVASTVLALLLTAVAVRTSLQRGFAQFLEQQEERQLHNLAPELAEYYQRAGSWEKLASNPRRWMRLLAQARPEGIRPPNEAPADFTRSGPGAPAHDPHPGSRHLWRRLFLLDENQRWVAGAGGSESKTEPLLAVEVDGNVVGWLGFQPAGNRMAPEARRYLEFQNRALLLSSLAALALASLLAFVLARNLARPVTRLRDTVQKLTRGDFKVRAGVKSRDEIGELARHVNRLAETLERNETVRRRWTADMAHELRTPLAILQGELDALKDGLRPFNVRNLESLAEEVAHLSSLVEDLQTLALADAGALNIRLQTVDLAGLLAQVLNSFSERISAAGLRLESSMPDRLELLADAQRMRQLLHNLLENSCRHTLAGGTVQVMLTADNSHAVLEIDDSEPGLDAQHLPRLFERFFRVDSSRTLRGVGSGLGLAICRNIVQAHGGEISASASPLGGLKIRVRLPRSV